MTDNEKDEEDVAGSNSDPKERRARRMRILAAKRARRRWPHRRGKFKEAKSGASSVTTKTPSSKVASNATAGTTFVTTTTKSKTTKSKGDAVTAAPSPVPPPTTVLTPEPTWQGLPRRRQSADKTAKNIITQQQQQHASLSPEQRQDVDTVFTTLFGYTWGTTTTAKTTTTTETTDLADNTPQRQRHALLRRILGPTRATRTIRRIHSARQRREPPTGDDAALRRLLLTGKLIVPQPTKLESSMPRTVVQNRKRTDRSGVSGVAVMSSAASRGSSSEPTAAVESSSTAPPPAGAGAGVDDLLSKLNDTGKTSTLTKTAVDWETFKRRQDNTGLATSLEEHTESKGAYLKRQDFLQRVDQRKFQRERRARERERNKKS